MFAFKGLVSLLPDKKHRRINVTSNLRKKSFDRIPLAVSEELSVFPNSNKQHAD